MRSAKTARTHGASGSNCADSKLGLRAFQAYVRQAEMQGRTLRRARRSSSLYTQRESLRALQNAVGDRLISVRSIVGRTLLFLHATNGRQFRVTRRECEMVNGIQALLGEPVADNVQSGLNEPITYAGQLLEGFISVALVGYWLICCESVANV